jgi:hypothetical protein
MSNDHHWLYGLEMYIDRYNAAAAERYHEIKESILRNNIHRIRDSLIKEVHRGYIPQSEDFINLLLHDYLPDRNHISRDDGHLISYLTHSIDDEYIKRISVTFKQFGSNVILNDHFSRGQMMSKFWMIDELKKVSDSFDTVIQYGGWYATLYQFLKNEFNINTYRNIELDPLAASIADTFNYAELADNWKFKSVVSDVNSLYWRKKQLDLQYKILTHDGKLVTEIRSPDLIINTSCEHMDETWFQNLPDGQLVCLQTNDYFSNEQHINCVNNTQEAIEKYPMSEVYFSGEIATFLYNRFMIIGKK